MNQKNQVNQFNQFKQSNQFNRVNQFKQSSKELYGTILRNSEIFPFLFVNENGTVIFNNKTHKVLSIYPHCNGYGYLQCTGGYWIHRVVAETYCEKPITDKTLEVNHKDGDKTNNNYQNLEWITHSENIKHSFSDFNRAGYWLGKKMPEYVAKAQSERMKDGKNNAAIMRKIYFDDGTETITYTRNEILQEMWKCGNMDMNILLVH